MCEDRPTDDQTGDLDVAHYLTRLRRITDGSPAAAASAVAEDAVRRYRTGGGVDEKPLREAWVALDALRLLRRGAA
jgi:hypothetical protein